MRKLPPITRPSAFGREKIEEPKCVGQSLGDWLLDKEKSGELPEDFPALGRVARFMNRYWYGLEPETKNPDSAGDSNHDQNPESKQKRRTVTRLQLAVSELTKRLDPKYQPHVSDWKEEDDVEAMKKYFVTKSDLVEKMKKSGKTAGFTEFPFVDQFREDYEKFKMPNKERVKPIAPIPTKSGEDDNDEEGDGSGTGDAKPVLNSVYKAVETISDALGNGYLAPWLLRLVKPGLTEDQRKQILEDVELRNHVLKRYRREYFGEASSWQKIKDGGREFKKKLRLNEMYELGSKFFWNSAASR